MEKWCTEDFNSLQCRDYDTASDGGGLTLSPQGDCVVSPFTVRQICPQRAVHPSRASGRTANRRAHHERTMGH